MGQTDIHVRDGHGNSMTNSALRGRVGENQVQEHRFCVESIFPRCLIKKLLVKQQKNGLKLYKMNPTSLASLYTWGGKLFKNPLLSFMPKSVILYLSCLTSNLLKAYRSSGVVKNPRMMALQTYYQKSDTTLQQSVWCQLLFFTAPMTLHFAVLPANPQECFGQEPEESARSGERGGPQRASVSG